MSKERASLFVELVQLPELELAQVIHNAGYTLAENVTVDEDFWAAAILLASKVKKRHQTGDTDARDQSDS